MHMLRVMLSLSLIVLCPSTALDNTLQIVEISLVEFVCLSYYCLACRFPNDFYCDFQVISGLIEEFPFKNIL